MDRIVLSALQPTDNLVGAGTVVGSAFPRGGDVLLPGIQVAPRRVRLPGFVLGLNWEA